MIGRPELSRTGRLARKDIPRAVQLILEGVKPYNSARLLKSSKLKSVSNKENRFITLRRDGGLVGFLMYRVEKRLCYIYEIHVAAEYRSFGEGQRMQDELIRSMKNFIFVLFVHKNNTRAMAFYSRNGFIVDEDYESPTYYRMSLCKG